MIWGKLSGKSGPLEPAAPLSLVCPPASARVAVWLVGLCRRWGRWSPLYRVGPFCLVCWSNALRRRGDLGPLYRRAWPAFRLVARPRLCGDGPFVLRQAQDERWVFPPLRGLPVVNVGCRGAWRSRPWREPHGCMGGVLLIVERCPGLKDVRH